LGELFSFFGFVQLVFMVLKETCIMLAGRTVAKVTDKIKGLNAQEGEKNV